MFVLLLGIKIIPNTQVVRLADQSFVLSWHRPTTNLCHSHLESDTNFSTCAVYHTHNSGRRPIVNNNNNNKSSFEGLHFYCGNFSYFCRSDLLCVSGEAYFLTDNHFQLQNC